MTRLLPLLVAMAACTGAAPEETGEPLDSDSGEVAVESQLYAVVTTTDFSVGSLATIDLDGWATEDEITTTSGDPLVFADGGFVFQVNGFSNDTVRTYTAGEFTTPLADFSVGSGANPHTARLVGDELFVSLYDAGSVGVYHPSTGAVLGSVDLSAYNDSDGSSEPDTMVVANDKLYVGLQQLDNWVPTGGLVVEVDPASRAVAKTFAVGLNPTVYAHGSDPTKLVTATGSYDSSFVALLDGGVGLLDPSTDGNTPTSFLSEVTLGFHVKGYVETDDGKALLFGEKPDATYAVGCFDWDTATYTPATTTSSFLTAVTLNDRGEAWVSTRVSWADANSTGGLRVWDVATCTEKTTTSLGTTLDPYSVAFY